MLTVPEPEVTYVIGDLHGDSPRALRLLERLGIVSVDAGSLVRWTAPPGTCVVQLGDQLDSAVRGEGRSPDWEALPDTSCVELFTRLARVAADAGGRVISLLGNHELMNVRGDHGYVSAKSLAMSGGAPGRTEMMRPGSDFVREHLATRPVIVKVGSVVMVHAGVLSRHLRCLSRVNGEVARWLDSAAPMSADVAGAVFDDAGLLWTRRYVDEDQDAVTEDLRRTLRALAATEVCVGHTVVPSIMRAAGGGAWLCDTGISRAIGGETVQVLRMTRGGARDVVQVTFGG